MHRIQLPIAEMTFRDGFYSLALFTGISYLCMIGFTSAEESKQDWYCGSGKFSEITSEALTTATCSSKKDALNNCCKEHDTCYDEQRGRENCDNAFCGCIDTNVLDGKESATGPGYQNNAGRRRKRRETNETSLKEVLKLEQHDVAIDSLMCEVATKYCDIVREHGQEAYDEAGKRKGNGTSSWNGSESAGPELGTCILSALTALMLLL